MQWVSLWNPIPLEQPLKVINPWQYYQEILVLILYIFDVMAVQVIYNFPVISRPFSLECGQSLKFAELTFLSIFMAHNVWTLPNVLVLWTSSTETRSPLTYDPAPGSNKERFVPLNQILVFQFFFQIPYIFWKKMASLIFLHPFTQMGSSTFSEGILNYYKV